MANIENSQNMNDPHSSRHFQSWSGKEMCGVALIIFAGITFGLLWMDRNTGLPFNMPSSWYKSKMIFFFMALFALPTSYLLMRKPPGAYDTSEAPEVALPNFRTFRFYTRNGCPLCDEALEIVKRYENVLPEIEVYDVDRDAELVERFNTCVPVVEIDGKIRFRGNVNEVLFRRLIEASARNSQPASGQVVPLQLPSSSRGS
ncbi:hypothetical protein Pla110_17290 [Polystyrenella longa]|uniref:Glutaredoxin n=1 Tax=Polystyrenella longa TaxID=2528007 RepID=A0A518CLA7_9PLAN|nr:glutaredoxin family protein [Polystyrenella longa]QDU80007.1 hypothetical protein Pla110_17290 [Polystyrenella longa]